ncbi:MAG: hypothetical protein AB1453_07915 [Chloroflexota bacterium]|jgi:hypothetical protein
MLNSFNSLIDTYLERIQRWIETAISRALRLDHFTARMRGFAVLGTFFFLWFAYTLWRHPLNEIGQALIGLVVPAELPEDANPLLFFFSALGNTFFSLDVLIMVAALALPFFLALEFAAIYQTDIYELPKPNISRRFLTQAAFAIPVYDTLHVSDEKLSPDQRRSAFIQIGGPGIVKPNPEFAIIFEQLNGRPHFIRAGMDKSERTLQGFERLRRIIDTRDHTFHYSKILGRTKDGIRIEIQDIKLLFSIWRRTNNNPLSNPYPAYRRDLYWLTYQQFGEHWTRAMTELVEEHLLRFIQSNTFGTLISAVGEPEILRQIELESTIQRISWQEPLRRPLIFIYTRDMPPVPTPPPFIPRTQLSNFFKDFAMEFPQAARQRGVRLEWINVGTWHTHEEIILDQHIEAWRLSVENLTRANSRVLEEIRNRIRVQTYQRIIQQNFLLTVAQLISRGYTNEQVWYELARHLEEQLSYIRSQLLAKNQPVPPWLVQGRDCIHAALLAYLKETGATVL